MALAQEDIDQIQSLIKKVPAETPDGQFSIGANTGFCVI